MRFIDNLSIISISCLTKTFVKAKISLTGGDNFSRLAATLEVCPGASGMDLRAGVQENDFCFWQKHGKQSQHVHR